MNPTLRSLGIGAGVGGLLYLLYTWWNARTAVSIGPAPDPSKPGGGAMTKPAPKPAPPPPVPASPPVIDPGTGKPSDMRPDETPREYGCRFGGRKGYEDAVSGNPRDWVSAMTIADLDRADRSGDPAQFRLGFQACYEAQYAVAIAAGDVGVAGCCGLKTPPAWDASSIAGADWWRAYRRGTR
jgi:hypothetical protein